MKAEAAKTFTVNNTCITSYYNNYQVAINANSNNNNVSCLIFTVRLHVMQRTVLLSEFCPSVCPPVCPSDACIVTKLNNALRIF